MLGLVGGCFLSSVFVSKHQIGMFRFFTFVVLVFCSVHVYCLLLNMLNTNHTALWSDPSSTEESRYRWSVASNDLVSTITRPQPNWDGLGKVGQQSERKAVNKCSAYVGTPWRSIPGDSPHEAGWKNAKLSSRQRVATLKNLNYKIYFDLFNTFFGYYMIPYVLFHSCDVFTIILQCWK